MYHIMLYISLLHILIFYEEIGIHINPQETFGLPKEIEWARHTGSQGKIDWLDGFAQEEIIKHNR